MNLLRRIGVTVMRSSLNIERRTETEGFENITEAEIISLWEVFKSSGLSADEAWNAIVAGIALDVAFARSKNLSTIEQ
jgi:hypothetical protein